MFCGFEGFKFCTLPHPHPVFLLQDQRMGNPHIEVHTPAKENESFSKIASIYKMVSTQYRNVKNSKINQTMTQHIDSNMKLTAPHFFLISVAENVGRKKINLKFSVSVFVIRKLYYAF